MTAGIRYLRIISMMFMMVFKFILIRFSQISSGFVAPARTEKTSFELLETNVGNTTLPVNDRSFWNGLFLVLVVISCLLGFYSFV